MIDLKVQKKKNNHKKVIVEIHIVFTHNVFENHTHSSKMFFFFIIEI